MLVSGDCFIFQSDYREEEDLNFGVSEYLKNYGDNLKKIELH